MRILMMISNSNVGARQLYGAVLRETYPGWGTSHMSGLPANPAAIIQAYDAVIYEMGAANDPKRYQATLALWNEIKETGTRLITHIEGPFAEGVVAELEAQGVVCVAPPFGPQTVAEALRRIAPAPKGGKEQKDGAERRGLFGGLFRRRE